MNIYSHNDLFLPNKYTRWYYSIIEKAQNQYRKKLDKDHPNFIYYEEHHILPRCMFPEYKNLRLYPWNGVLLNAREHYICHALLCKMTEIGYNKFKLYTAFRKMQFSDKNQKRYTSRLYEYFKKEYSKLYKFRIVSDETKKKTSNSMKNKKWWNNGIISCMSENSPGDEWVKGRIGIDNKTKKGKKFSEQARKNMSEVKKNKIYTEKDRYNMGKSNRNKKLYNNGIINEYFECDPGNGWIKGSLKNNVIWYNNGIKSGRFNSVPPDSTWVKGRLPYSRTRQSIPE